MACSLILTANAGVIMTVGDRQFLVDALHNEKMPGFSAVPPNVLPAVWRRFQSCAPTAVITTHAHPDHVSTALWNEARLRWPASFFISPGAPLEGTIVLNDPRQRIFLAGAALDAVRLPHQGSGFEPIVNYGFFFEIDGFNVLIPGDCSVSALDMLSELIAGRHVDVALLNFPWITLSGPRDFVLNSIAPSHLVLFHLPFREDDSEGYRPAAFKEANVISSVAVRLLSEPFQEVVVE
ncbi:Beta-lactamase superfamily domain-containing protein [Sporobacter termitidis DSM 10068]|uniref:Beta-lactamase superfamily domain-containing protein n=1 Tax=Sporobacter termitidis DSM 10068 TaxID=1123282 RepID=A0A1M5YR65_9FIRM|nr:MBL fold metallo-hydrolase [Sporobacter termitidis]SHI14350.1 Beta-lactamase superfamily domain-containing protein [Sporobacter termitidis DSM 10068]